MRKYITNNHMIINKYWQCIYGMNEVAKDNIRYFEQKSLDVHKTTLQYCTGSN